MHVIMAYETAEAVPLPGIALSASRATAGVPSISPYVSPMLRASATYALATSSSSATGFIELSRLLTVDALLRSDYPLAPPNQSLLLAARGTALVIHVISLI